MSPARSGTTTSRSDRGRYEFPLLRMPAPYYVRRVEEVEVIVLDSNSVSAVQTTWLRRTLAARTGFRRIVVLHHPPFTCGGHLGSAAVRRAWVPLFRRYGVRLVLSGHDHNYQRFPATASRTSSTAAGERGSTSSGPARRRTRAGSRRASGTASSTCPSSRTASSSAGRDLDGSTIDRFAVTGWPRCAVGEM